MLRTIPRIGLAVFVSLFGKAPAQSPAFDVTSVKPYKPGSAPGPTAFGCTPEAGHFSAARTGVALSIRWAYNLGPYQTLNLVPVNRQYIIGLPAWASGAEGVFDIEGKAAGPVTEAQCRLMLQALLMDRFKLTVHRETKTLPVTALVVAKGGPKPKLTKALDSDKDKRVFVNGTPAYGSANGWSMAQLSEFLMRVYPGQIVVDRTGLEGLYRFSLDYAVKPPTGGGPVDCSDEVSAALAEQLGLKVENRNEAVEVLVIDHIEKPSGN